MIDSQAQKISNCGWNSFRSFQMNSKQEKSSLSFQAQVVVIVLASIRRYHFSLKSLLSF
jgi:hypothetical protein